MIIKNRIEKPFGPAGASAGYFIFIGGVIASFYALTSLILIPFGAFLSFTSVSALLDIDRNRAKLSTYLFGIIPVGKWIELKPEMKIGLKKVQRGYRTYSRSNRVLDIIKGDIRIILYGANNKELMPIKKFKSSKEAKNELVILSRDLELKIKE